MTSQYPSQFEPAPLARVLAGRLRAYVACSCSGDPFRAAVAVVLVNEAEREVGREARWLGEQVVAGDVALPATSQSGELGAVWFALLAAPPDVGLTVVTASDYAVGVLSGAYRAAAHGELVAEVQRALQQRGADVVHVGQESRTHHRLALRLAREALRLGGPGEPQRKEVR